MINMKTNISYKDVNVKKTRLEIGTST